MTQQDTDEWITKADTETKPVPPGEVPSRRPKSDEPATREGDWLRSQGEVGKAPSTRQDSRHEEMASGPSDPAAARAAHLEIPAWYFVPLRSEPAAMEVPATAPVSAGDNPAKKSDLEEDNESQRVLGKLAPGTLPKGGMSPVADRKEPSAWSGPARPVGATGMAPEASRTDERRVTPPEPVGGWVDTSTRSGKNLDPKKGAENLALGRFTREEANALVQSWQDDVGEKADASRDSAAGMERDPGAKRGAKTMPRTDEGDQD